MWARTVIPLVFLPGCTDQVVGTFAASSGPGTGFASTSGPMREPGSAGSSAAGSTGAPSPGSSGGASGGATSGSTGMPPSPEVCDGIDNDQDGLVDEVGPDNTSCGGCTLSQGVGKAWWACDAQLPWADANARCETFGATLGLARTADDTAFLLATIDRSLMFFWLGAREGAAEGSWSWVDGMPLSGYSNWAGMQPDDLQGAQDCLRITFGITVNGWFQGAWDDFFCDQAIHVLCSAPHVLP